MEEIGFFSLQIPIITEDRFPPMHPITGIQIEDQRKTRIILGSSNVFFLSSWKDDFQSYRKKVIGTRSTASYLYTT